MLIVQKLERIVTRSDTGDARGAVATYLVEASRVFENETLSSVAEAAGVSRPTVVRVAQDLGFSGWTEFSRAYAAECVLRRERETDVSHSLPFGPSDTPLSAADALARMEAESIRETAAMLDADAFNRAVDSLRHAQHIVLLGNTNQHMLLETFSFKILNISRRVVLPSMECMAAACQSVGAGDCAVAVSYSGETADRPPMSLLDGLRERGARIIALTGEGDNYLRAHADIVLTILSYENLYHKIAEYSTEASVKYLLDSLYAGLFLGDFEENYDTRLRFRSAFDRARGPERG